MPDDFSFQATRAIEANHSDLKKKETIKVKKETISMGVSISRQLQQLI